MKKLLLIFTIVFVCLYHMYMAIDTHCGREYILKNFKCTDRIKVHLISKNVLERIRSGYYQSNPKNLIRLNMVDYYLEDLIRIESGNSNIKLESDSIHKVVYRVRKEWGV